MSVEAPNYLHNGFLFVSLARQPRTPFGARRPTPSLLMGRVHPNNRGRPIDNASAHVWQAKYHRSRVDLRNDQMKMKIRVMVIVTSRS